MTSYLRYSGSEWVKTGVMCPRDGLEILQEQREDGTRIDWFSCPDSRCTWPEYEENIQLIKLGMGENDKAKSLEMSVWQETMRDLTDIALESYDLLGFFLEGYSQPTSLMKAWEIALKIHPDLVDLHEQSKPDMALKSDIEDRWKKGQEKLSQISVISDRYINSPASELLRVSGRTTRMIEHAIDLAKAGKTVVIYGNTWDYVSMIMLEVRNLLLETHVPVSPRSDWERSISIKNGGRIIGNTTSTPDFDWRLLKSINMPSTAIHLVDHYAIERKFGDVLDMWVRFV